MLTAGLSELFDVRHREADGEGGVPAGEAEPTDGGGHQGGLEGHYSQGADGEHLGMLQKEPFWGVRERKNIVRRGCGERNCPVGMLQQGG